MNTGELNTPRDIYYQRLNYSWEQNLAVWYNSHEVFLHDHLGGFDKNFKNEMFGKIPSGVTLRTEYLVNQTIRNQYSNITLQFDALAMITNNQFNTFVGKQFVKTEQIENFLCSFFRSTYQGRVWLLCWLHELGWFDINYGSKNFVIDQYPSEIKDLYLAKIGNDFEDATKQHHRQQMQQSLKFLGNPDATPSQDLLSVKDTIQKSFVCVVAETHPTHYYPFPTEKFLYPIVNSTLWVSYAQPGYHQFIKNYLGFQLYDCFDYQFDTVDDHIQRLSMLTDMLQKFSTMTPEQWNRVYLTQQEIIRYNAEHARSGRFIKHLRQFDEVAR